MKIRKISLKNGLFVFGAVLAAAMMMFLVFHFIEQVRQNEIDATNKNLVGIADSNAASVWQTMHELIGSLRMTAAFVEKYDDFKSPEVLSTLNEIAKECGFERLAINYPNGMSYTSDGHIIDASGLGRIEHIKRGEIFIDDVANALADGTPIINIHVPLHDSREKPIAALRLAMRTEQLNSIFNLTFWNDEGYFHLIDENGRYVATSAPDKSLTRDGHFYQLFEKVVFNSPADGGKMKRDLDKGGSGFVEYSFEGVRKHAYYAPVGVNKWTMIVVIPDAVLDARTNVNVGYAMTTMIHLALILLVIFIVVYFVIVGSMKKVILNEKCFRILADRSGKIIFEWDFANKVLASHGNFEKTFARGFVGGQSPESALQSGIIHDDDREVFIHIYEVINSGEDIDRAKLRMKDGDEHFRWCSLSGVVVKNDRGKPYKAIITIEDIDKEEREKEHLQFRAMTDPLTGLYNKTATAALSAEVLAGSNETNLHAVVCVDLDEFKGINDNFGHLFGDEVLQEVAEKIKLSFRSSDILGRFGGDEFVLLIRDIPDINFAREKTAHLVDAIKTTYKLGDAEHSICASVGVSIYPLDGTSYEELHGKADTASYKAKNDGKCRVVFYKEDIE